MANSQKFIGRNRAPRVHITCDVEGDESQKKVEIPFVMGVMAELSGKSLKPKADLRDRRFVDCPTDEKLDKMMEALAPRAAFAVENTMGGGGMINVDLTFNSMKDFTPEQVASKVDGLKQLLELRNALKDFRAQTDGKQRTEQWLTEFLASYKTQLPAEPK